MTWVERITGRGAAAEGPRSYLGELENSMTWVERITGRGAAAEGPRSYLGCQQGT